LGKFATLELELRLVYDSKRHLFPGLQRRPRRIIAQMKHPATNNLYGSQQTFLKLDKGITTGVVTVGIKITVISVAYRGDKDNA
jgi:hypothetical protein